MNWSLLTFPPPPTPPKRTIERLGLMVRRVEEVRYISISYQYYYCFYLFVCTYIFFSFNLLANLEFQVLCVLSREEKEGNHLSVVENEFWNQNLSLGAWIGRFVWDSVQNKFSIHLWNVHGLGGTTTALLSSRVPTSLTVSLEHRFKFDLNEKICHILVLSIHNIEKCVDFYHQSK